MIPFPPPPPRNRTSAERHRRAAAVARHVAQFGAWCPGYGVPSHTSRDLTADHVIARSLGGEDGELRVLCRSCNTRRGAAMGGRDGIENASQPRHLPVARGRSRANCGSRGASGRQGANA